MVNKIFIYGEKGSLLEVFMKRFAFIAITVVFALVLVTCEEFNGMWNDLSGKEKEEWTDVEYEIDGVVGQERVKSIKFYLQPENVERSALPGPNTYGVKVTDKQRAIRRALSSETAAASHDFFEAVFHITDDRIVRTSWDIGYSAGVSRSQLATGATTNYQPLVRGTAQASTVFVGKKTNKTLLGVGFLTHVNDVAIGGGTPAVTGAITGDTYSITYTVAPVKTWLGYSSAAGVAGVLRTRPIYGDEGGTGTAVATFETELGAPYGRNESFTPVQGQTGVTYPLFTRKAFSSNPTTMTATYRIGGLSGFTTGNTGLATAQLPADNSVLAAIRVYGTSNGTASLVPGTGEINPSTGSPRGGMQVIKRTPSILYQGRTYEAGAYDQFTTLGGAAPPTGNGTSPVVNNTHGNAFANAITLTFNITNESKGIFAFTFQCPVYAITMLNGRQSSSDIDANSRFVKWFIRPADGANLYLLDSGFNEGGMVMIGDMASSGNDWIEIKTTGIGFQNN